MKQVTPLDNRVLILPTDPAEFTKGGIALPTNAREKPTEGTVISAGPGRRADSGELIKPGVEEGDTVIYSKYAGTEIKVEGVTHVLLRDSDILAKITETSVAEPAAS
jgi:chaperonin GroES